MNEYELRWIYVYIVYNCKTDRLIFSDVMYIGQTRDLSERHYHHTYKKHTKAICDKFITTHKYEFIPLMCGFSKDIDSMEKYLIKKWCTSFNEGLGLNISSGGLSGGSTRVPINQYDLGGKYIRTFYGGVKEASDVLGIKHRSSITSCCRLKITSFKGYMWRYFEGDVSNIEPHKKNYARKRIVYQYTTDLTFIKEWDSVRSIERELQINHGDVIKCCNDLEKSYKGYKFSYTKI